MEMQRRENSALGADKDRFEEQLRFNFSPARVLLSKRLRGWNCRVGHFQRKGFAQGLRETEKQSGDE